MFSFMANTSGHFYKNFQGFTYCSVFKVLRCFATARLIYHSFAVLSTAFLKVFSNFTCCLKGRSLFGSFVPVDQGHGISYHPSRQKSTPCLQSFLNCFKCIYNSRIPSFALCIFTIRIEKPSTLHCTQRMSKALFALFALSCAPCTDRRTHCTEHEQVKHIFIGTGALLEYTDNAGRNRRKDGV